MTEGRSLDNVFLHLSCLPFFIFNETPFCLASSCCIDVTLSQYYVPSARRTKFDHHFIY